MADKVSHSPSSTLLSPGWWSKVKQRLGRGTDKNASSPKNRASSAPRSYQREGTSNNDIQSQYRAKQRSASVERRPRRRLADQPHETDTKSSPRSARARAQYHQRRAVTVSVHRKTRSPGKHTRVHSPQQPQRLRSTRSTSSSSSESSASDSASQTGGPQPQLPNTSKGDESDSDSEVIALDAASVDLWMQDKSGDFFESQRSARLRTALVAQVGGYAEDDISTDSDSAEDLEGGPEGFSTSSLFSASHKSETEQTCNASGFLPATDTESETLRQDSDFAIVGLAGLGQLLRKSSSFALKVRTPQALERKLGQARVASDDTIVKSKSDPTASSGSLARRVSFNNMKSRRAHLKVTSKRSSLPSPRHAPRRHSAAPERSILKQQSSADSMLTNTYSFNSTLSDDVTGVQVQQNIPTGHRVPPTGNGEDEVQGASATSPGGSNRATQGLAVITSPLLDDHTAVSFGQHALEKRSSAKSASEEWSHTDLGQLQNIPASPASSTTSASVSDHEQLRCDTNPLNRSRPATVPVPLHEREAHRQSGQGSADCRLSTACALLEQVKAGSGSSSSVSDVGALHKLGSLPRNGQGVESVMDMLFDSPAIRTFLLQALQHKVSELHPGKEIDISDTRLLMQVVGLARWLKMSTKRWDALIQGSALLLSASDPSSNAES